MPDIIEFITDIFDPKKNGFKIVNDINKINTGPDYANECWTDEKCLLMNSKYEEQLIESLKTIDVLGKR